MGNQIEKSSLDNVERRLGLYKEELKILENVPEGQRKKRQRERIYQLRGNLIPRAEKRLRELKGKSRRRWQLVRA